MKLYYHIFLLLLACLSSCDPDRQTSETVPSATLSTGQGLLEVWPEGGPELLWTHEGLGRGYGGPCISTAGIFINAEEDGNSFTVGLDHQGRIQWKSPNGKEFLGTDFSATYPGTRSAPTVYGGLVYAASGLGQVSCFDQNGALIWTVDLVQEYQGKPGDFGYSESPVVDEDKVYCFTGGKVHNMVALDRLSGALLWSAPVNRDSFAYSTPILLDLPGRQVLIGTSRNYIHVVDRQDGTLLSSYRLEDISYGNEHCNSVVHEEGFLYFVACEEHGQGTVKLSLSEDGKSIREVWRNPEVINVFEGFVLVDNLLYTTMENKKLLSLDTETGRIRHSVRALSGNIVHADGKLFIYGHNGRLQLFRLENGKPELRSEMRITRGTGQHFSFPVIADGIMYIRRGDALMAFKLR